MLIAGIATLALGIAIVFSSFVVAAGNMGRGAKAMFADFDQPLSHGRHNVDHGMSAFGKMFGNHIGAMVGMAIGGLVTFIGFILTVYGAIVTIFGL
jgi:hypothetical protein